MTDGLAGRLAEINARIDKAARAVDRNSSDIQLLGVSKTHPPSAIKDLYKHGLTSFGENKVQEAETKIQELGTNAITWHLIGHLQSNKARKAVQLFDVIQSLDSIDLAERLERICKEEGRDELKVYIEVDLAGEETKNGLHQERVPALASYLQSCQHLKLAGLMVLPPYSDDPELARPYFRQLRELRDALHADGVFGSQPGELSMGMSHDFEVAIEEGATIVRVGTALFGERYR